MLENDKIFTCFLASLFLLKFPCLQQLYYGTENSVLETEVSHISKWEIDGVIFLIKEGYKILQEIVGKGVMDSCVH